ncbi:uncharacterized protein EI90DRAFT_3016595 [Cantharellus anzutake]|uniref:uncharacterized protein n=1 Tax=Cantharellus anzutake TaxID=1750568 RepID=UPI001905A3E4|nr:uncharacterized protein EI90DRAFT_3016595 [Cantharellus anzutake]KAF8330745.1 hypothetical protein EI90DRAFT_3016595 [Cantharellus anzutake]
MVFIVEVRTTKRNLVRIFELIAHTNIRVSSSVHLVTPLGYPLSSNMHQCLCVTPTQTCSNYLLFVLKTGWINTSSDEVPSVQNTISISVLSDDNHTSAPQWVSLPGNCYPLQRLFTIQEPTEWQLALEQESSSIPAGPRAVEIQSIIRNSMTVPGFLGSDRSMFPWKF